MGKEERKSNLALKKENKIKKIWNVVFAFVFTARDCDAAAAAATAAPAGQRQHQHHNNNTLWTNERTVNSTENPPTDSRCGGCCSSSCCCRCCCSCCYCKPCFLFIFILCVCAKRATVNGIQKATAPPDQVGGPGLIDVLTLLCLDFI